MNKQKYNTKKILLSIVWVLVGISSIVLLIAAIGNKNEKICRAVTINIAGVSSNFFIDKNDIYKIIKNNGGDTVLHSPISKINISLIEKKLEENIWIKNAELYFDNNNVLNVNIEEREPIARVFGNFDTSFYIDSSCKVLPLSNKFSARLPIFTGFNSNVENISTNDSILLKSIKNIGTKIISDTFLMALIEQIDISANNNFEMIPKIGNQKIIFGDATDIDEKFDKLKKFYKNIIVHSGWNKYNKINLQYKNQIVASVRGKEDVVADSLSTMQLMQTIALNTANLAADSAQNFVPDNAKGNNDSTLIQQSVERDEENQQSTINQNAAIVATPVINEAPKQTTLKKIVDVKNLPKQNAAPKVVVKPTITKQIPENKIKPKAILKKTEKIK
ncbi:MAG: FtsQ-type POTRA domain-containing protein [Ferruginibacter sp.]|nr:FtsQ-type POTRA domain-containing protein [Ferruginibacter sp.]